MWNYCFFSDDSTQTNKKNGFQFPRLSHFQLVSLFSMIIQFVAIAERDEIMLNKEDDASTNMFSFIFSMGILVSFFKLTSDLLVMYGAKKVSGSKQHDDDYDRLQ